MNVFKAACVLSIAVTLQVLQDTFKEVQCKYWYSSSFQDDVDLDATILVVSEAGGRVRSQFRSVYKGFSAELSDEQLDMVMQVKPTVPCRKPSYMDMMLSLKKNLKNELT